MAVFLVSLVMALVCSVRAIPEETPSNRQSHNRGSFTNYVDKLLVFFDRLTYIYNWHDYKHENNLHNRWHFQCPLPTSPCQHSLWTTPSGNTARAPQSQSSSLDWLNPFTWFYRGDGERNNEEMKGGGGSSVINVQSQRKILRRRLGLVNIVRSYWFTYIIISESS